MLELSAINQVFTKQTNPPAFVLPQGRIQNSTITWESRSCLQIVAAWEWRIWVWGELLPSLSKFVIGNSIKCYSKQFFLGFPRINYSESLRQKLVKNAHLQLSPKPSLFYSWKLGLTHFSVFLSLSFLFFFNKRDQVGEENPPMVCIMCSHIS